MITINPNKYESTSISALIDELRSDKELMEYLTSKSSRVGDHLEDIATYLIMTDEPITFKVSNILESLKA